MRVESANRENIQGKFDAVWKLCNMLCRLVPSIKVELTVKRVYTKDVIDYIKRLERLVDERQS